MKNMFKQRVQMIVSEIPKGSVMTYKQVATKAGSAGAARAVGSIMRNNQDKTIPCHRVVRSDGVIGEYNGLRGQDKSLLLSQEGVNIVNGKVTFRD